MRSCMADKLSDVEEAQHDRIFARRKRTFQLHQRERKPEHGSRSNKRLRTMCVIHVLVVLSIHIIGLRRSSKNHCFVPGLSQCEVWTVHAFSHAGPAVWNALPEDIRANHDRAVFRKQLKTHFFTLAFNVR